MHDAEAGLVDHVNQLLTGHEKLLNDARRNQLFYRALEQRVTGAASVLDIGSGTGLWAIAAARLGARRVVAVEQDLLLIGLIKALAQANGVADRIEAVQGDSRQLQLDREFDIVISETIGHLVFDEQVASIMIDARERFLKPGGALIPESVALVASAAHLAARHSKLPAGITVEYDYFESLLLNNPISLTERAELKMMSEPQELIRADLTAIKSPPSLNDLTARWAPQATNQINCFAVWAEATLTHDIRLETLHTSSWAPMIYRVRPFKEKAGALEFKLTLTTTGNYWTATLTTDQAQETQSYSPAAAATVLLARARADVDLLNHLQRIGLTS
jgi:predicted RNA methylase